MSPDTAVADPDALAAELRSRVEEAAKRLEQTAAETTDDQARAPSQLPDWSRGHVLTHLARNADGLRNLLVWARTGVETPQYPSVQARNDGIEAGAGRRAAELAADIAESAAQFAAEAARLSGADWTVQVAGVRAADTRPGSPSGAGCPKWRSTTSTWASATGRRTGQSSSPASAWAWWLTASPDRTALQLCWCRQTTAPSTGSDRQGSRPRSPRPARRASCWPG